MATLLDAEFTRTSRYSVIENWVESKRDQIQAVNVRSVAPTPLLRLLNKMARSVGIPPSFELSDISAIFDREDYSEAKVQLFRTKGRYILRNLVTTLNSMETSLGGGVMRTNYDETLLPPMLRPVICHPMLVSSIAGLLAVGVVFCPECDVVIATLESGTQVTAGGLAGLISAVYGLAAVFVC